VPELSRVQGSTPLRFGIVGLSAGNGHPYSWAAILNGYDPMAMRLCPFPVIPAYLAEHEIYPGSLGAVVSHVWCPRLEDAEEIARAAKIPVVSKSLEDLVAEVDGVLHARDDYENHSKFAKEYTSARTPVYIDKPLAVTLREAEEIFSMDPRGEMIFTCSALRFSPEIDASLNSKSEEVMKVSAIGPKDWRKYGIHLIEPALRLARPVGSPSRVSIESTGMSRRVKYSWAAGQSISVETTGRTDTAFKLEIDGRSMALTNTFEAFRRALGEFVKFCRSRELQISRSSTLQVVDLIERGDR